MIPLNYNKHSSEERIHTFQSIIKEIQDLLGGAAMDNWELFVHKEQVSQREQGWEDHPDLGCGGISGKAERVGELWLQERADTFAVHGDCH